mgnify:CR=1 FL=1
MSQQQQQDDERRRFEDDEIEARAYESAREASLRTAAYADQRRISPPREGFGDYGPDLGVDGSFGYRERQYNAQMRANIEYSDAQKGKRR